MAKIVDIRTKQNTPEVAEPKRPSVWRKVALYVGIACFVGAFLYLMSDAGNTLDKQQSELDGLNQTYNQKLQDNADKEKRLENADDLNSIEQTAREKLKYTKDGEILFVLGE